VTTNALDRELSKQAGANLLPFRVVVFAVGVASAATRVFLQPAPPPAFRCPLKTKRKGALRVAANPQGRDTRVARLGGEAPAPRLGDLAGVAFPLLLVKPVFTTEAGRVGLLSLVSRETPVAVDALPTPAPPAGQWSGIRSRSNRTSRCPSPPRNRSPRNPLTSLPPWVAFANWRGGKGNPS
jgi:hypothetical protein